MNRAMKKKYILTYRNRYKYSISYQIWNKYIYYISNKYSIYIVFVLNIILFISYKQNFSPFIYK